MGAQCPRTKQRAEGWVTDTRSRFQQGVRGEGAMVTKAREKEPTSRRAAYLTNGERKIAPAPPGTAVGHQAVPRVALPPRYAMIGLGSGLLMLASVASIPLGLAETAPPREV